MSKLFVRGLDAQDDVDITSLTIEFLDQNINQK